MAPPRRASARFSAIKQDTAVAKKPDARNKRPEPPRKKRRPNTHSKDVKDLKDLKDETPTSVESPPAPETDPMEAEYTALPRKIIEGQPMPTLSKSQPATLDEAKYSAVEESGVLPVAMKRSRDLWLSGICFDTFYKRIPHKKIKERTDEDRKALTAERALIKSLVKIGECSLTVQPHRFEISLYYKHEPVKAPKQVHRPAPQYAAPSGTGYIQHYQSGYSPSPNPGNQAVGRPGHHTHHPATTAASHSTPTHFHQQQQKHNPSHQYHATPQHQHQQQQQQQQQKQLPPPPPPQQRPPVSNGHTMSGVNTPRAPKPPQPPQSQQPVNRPVSTPQAAPSTPQTSTDPVITLLATRAGHDSRLKSVMKIVAAGKATPDQLAYFQNHITELNELVERNRRAGLPLTTYSAPGSYSHTPRQQKPAVSHHPTPTNATPTLTPLAAHTKPHPPSKPAAHSTPTQPNQVHPPSRPTANPPPPPIQYQTPVHQPPKPIPRPVQQTSQHNHPHQQYQPQHQHHHQQQRPTYAPPPPVVPAFRPIYFQFQEGSHDQWFVFPRKSIVEVTNSGKDMLCSFVIVKKGSALASLQQPPSSTTTPALGASSVDTSTLTKAQPVLDPEKEYYECATAKFTALDTSTLPWLSSAVDPSAEVCKYMEDIFQRADFLGEAFVALRLPKEDTTNGE